jgi:ankyrin repeat protein
MALVQVRGATFMLQVPLFHSMAFTNAHPHRELAESARLLIAAGADVNAKTTGPHNDERTVLMCAAERRCCIAVLDILLQAGADACATSSLKHMTALHLAAVAGSVGCCELLLARADTLLDRGDADGVTALMHASHSGRLDNALLLVQHGADVNAVDSAGCTALMAAAQSHNVAAAQLLLHHGADLNATDIDGQNALFKAVYEGDVTMMEILVQRGASIAAVDSLGHTLLMAAAAVGHKAAAEWLLQHGAAVNAATNDGVTALHRASATEIDDDATMLELLLANGADLHKHSNNGSTSLDAAALFGNVQCAKVLVAAGADVNLADRRGTTSLHMAVDRRHSAVAQLLLELAATAVMNSILLRPCEHGAHCCATISALTMCTETDTVKVLLAAGADVHVTNDVGDSCLHAAAKHNWTAPMLCLLIKAGADLHAVNNEGKTAAQLAHNRGYTLIEQLLNRAAQ